MLFELCALGYLLSAVDLRNDSLGGRGLGNRKASMLIYMGIVFPIENGIVFINI